MYGILETFTDDEGTIFSIIELKTGKKINEKFYSIQNAIDYIEKYLKED